VTRWDKLKHSLEVTTAFSWRNSRACY